MLLGAQSCGGEGVEKSTLLLNLYYTFFLTVQQPTEQKKKKTLCVHLSCSWSAEHTDAEDSSLNRTYSFNLVLLCLTFYRFSGY